MRLQAARQKARDRRIEDAAAHVFTRLEQRAEAEQTIAATNAAIGEALTRLAGEGLSVEAVAELLELDVAEVRRLSRMAASTPAGAVGGEDRDAGRRAG